MKKTYLILIILTLVIGFASVSTIIYINGKTNIGANLEDYSIYFSETYIDDEERLDVISEDKQKITINTKVLKDIGDSEKLEYDVTNASKQYDAKVSITCEPTENEYYEMEHVFEHEIIKARTYETGYITIKLKKVSVEEQDIEFTCTLKVDALEKTELNTSRVKTRCEYDEGQEWTFDYKGSEQTFEVPCDATYKVELWGAQGGNGYSTYLRVGTGIGGKGAYTKGEIQLYKDDTYYLYIGGVGTNGSTVRASSDYLTNGGYNGGGKGYARNNNNSYVHNSGSGGGATDFRLVDGAWNNFESLKSRIMVAAGGSGGSGHEGSNPGAYAGGLTGGTGNNISGLWSIQYGATQTSGGSATQNAHIGSFGKGADAFAISNNQQSSGSGAGSGYYGGAVGVWGPGSGGSSFISGHTGCNAIKETSTSTSIQHTGQPNHYSGLIFSNTQMNSGNESMPTHDGKSTMVGNSGNGYAKITLISFEN